MKTKILADFQICISVLLISSNKTKIVTDSNDKIQTKNSEGHVSFVCFSSVKHFISLVFTLRIN